MFIQTFRIYITYTFSRWIYAILDIRFFCKSWYSVHIMYTISCLIFAIFNIQFFANPETPYVYNVHNFLYNFLSSGHSIFLLITTVRKYITYTIFRWIFATLDIQFFYTSWHSVHVMYTICFWIFSILDIQFFC